MAGADERVMLEAWQPGAMVELANAKGLELLVLAGDFADGTEMPDRWSWLRLPAGEPLRARVGPQGARVWFKFAPLLHRDVCAFENGSVDHQLRPAVSRSQV